MPQRTARREHIGEQQRINDILRALGNVTECKLSDKTSIRTRVEQNKKLNTIYRSKNNGGNYISKRVLADMIDVGMNNQSFAKQISQCEKERWLIVLDEPSEIKALFPRNSADGTQAALGKPILFLTKKGREITKGMTYCRYEKFDDVLKGMANEFDNETQELILKLAEMIGKEKPNPFFEIDKPKIHRN